MWRWQEGHLDCLHGTQGMDISVSPCLSGVEGNSSMVNVSLFFGILSILSQASREVLYKKLFMVVKPQKHKAQEKKRNGPGTFFWGTAWAGQPWTISRIALAVESGQAGEIECHRVVRKDAVQLETWEATGMLIQHLWSNLKRNANRGDR